MDSVIKQSFWTDEALEESTPAIKLACLWLISNPSRDICGFSKVSNKRFTFETAMDPTVLDDTCKALPSSFYAPCKGVYFAVNFLRHQFGKGGTLSRSNKVVIAAVRHAKALPSPLQAAFFKAYPELLETTHGTDEKASSIEAPSEKSEGVIEGEGEREGAGAEHCNGHSNGKPSLAELAQTIVSTYPRREKTAEALREVHRQLKAAADSAETAATMLANTRAFAAVIQTLPSGANNTYVPSALTFFAEKRYLDDPRTISRRGNRDGAMAPPPTPASESGRRPAQTITLNP